MRRESRPFRKFLFWAVVTIAAVEGIWFFGANWALDSELVIGAINKKPEKLEVLWGDASTYLPGVIHVEDLSVRGSSKRQQWQVKLDQVRVHLALLSLPFKVFRTYDVEGEGLDFQLSKKGQKPTDEVAGTGEEELDADEPVAATGSQEDTSKNQVEGGVQVAREKEATPSATSPDPKKKSKRPWRFGLRNIHIEGRESIGVLGYVLSGQGTIDADLGLELKGGPLSLERTRVNLEQAVFEVKGKQAASDLIVDLDVSLSPFVPKEVQGFEVLGSLSGEVGLQGKTQGAGVFNMFLSRFHGFEIGSEGGLLDTALSFDNGVVIPGSRLGLKSPNGWIRLSGLRVTTALEVNMEVDSAEPDGTKMMVAVDDVELSVDDDENGPLLEGADITLRATAPGIDFATGMDGLREAFDSIAVDLTEAVVADITRFPIPDFRDFSLDRGRIAVEGHFESTPELATGTFNVAGQGIDASFSEVGLVGDLQIDMKISSTDPRSQAFRIDEGVISVDNVTMTQSDKKAKEKDEDWYAHVKLVDGELVAKAPQQMSGDIEIRMRDTRPLITIFAQDKKVLRWFKGMLNFKDLEGTAGVEMEGDITEIKDLDIDSEGLKVKANMRIGNKTGGGIMWVKFHGINVGIDTREGTDVRLKKPRRWYDEQAAIWAGEPLPAAAVAN